MESERKTKVFFNGQIVDATIIPIVSGEDKWSSYMLSDGTALKMKIVVTEVYRLDNVYEPDGSPVYHIKSSTVASASAPENLKRMPGV